MKKNHDDHALIFLYIVILFVVTLAVAYTLSFSLTKLINRSSAIGQYKESQQQGTFGLITLTPTPITPTPTRRPGVTLPPTPTLPAGATHSPPVTTPISSSSQPPATTNQYCVDEEPGTVHIEACDDSTRCDIAHGAGGPTSTCGSVIGWEHVIIESVLTQTGSQYNRRLLDAFSGLSSSCYTAAPYTPYISTFNVIDAYSLAGFREFTRGAHADAAVLTNAWRTTAGYSVTATSQGLTPGDSILFANPAHVGIVNTVEVDSRGNGDVWFLHTGAAYYLGKVMVANWTVVSSSTGDTAVLFGTHQSRGADATRGETVCYCGSVCYQWTFP